MTEKITRQSTNWTVHTSDEQRVEIVKLCDGLNNLIAKESGVDTMSITRANLVLLSLRTAVEQRKALGRNT